MTSNANLGAERPQPSPKAAPQDGVETGSNFSSDRQGVEAKAAGDHSPEAKALLRRYLSEIHGYRQLGNAALSELERRLLALSEAGVATQIQQIPRAGSALSPLTRASIQQEEPAEEKSPNLTDRLKELSAYLHADLTRQQSMKADLQSRREDQPRQPAPRQELHSRPENTAQTESGPRPGAGHKPPNAPVLDRAWFEERFATMRASINQLAEQIPTRRLEALENQFHQLMEKLEANQADRSMAAVEAGLKKLAAYLEDNKQWSHKQDARVCGIEERLDQLSGLVAQSHAALSATAKGLEIVARGTGSQLAQATADLVAEKLEPRMKGLDQKGAIMELGGEVDKLSEQSKRLIRTTDERLKQLQNSLDESLDRLEDFESPQSRPHAEEGWHDRIEKDRIDDKYDGKTLAAARRAARLGEDRARGLPQHGEPIRYQIPYGEFLPEEERASSRLGLVIAAIILLLASAAMLYLNLRERGSGGAISSAWFSKILQEREHIPSPAPFSAAATDAKTAEPAQQTPQTGGGFVQKPWVVSVKSHSIAAPGATHDLSPGAHAAAAAEPIASTDDAAGHGRLTVNSSPKADSLRAAAVAGDAEAQFSIGETYLQGRNIDQRMPVTERLSKAARWFRRAAENGHAPSQYRLATLYELGQGAPKDHAEAMIWYERAAESGHIKAMHNLAVLSITRVGRSANYLTAAKWFAKAAEHGLADSQYNLGVLYERGLGVSKDSATAYRWFSLAAKQGDQKAAQKRDELATHLTSAELAQENEKTLAWAAEETDLAANSQAPEPPAEQPDRAEAAIEPKTPSAQLLKSEWNAQITQLNTIVAEAQRLLMQLGYKPGPVDGIAGPRTLAAIRAFERKIGLPGTGRITDMLVAKMAFALSS